MSMVEKAGTAIKEELAVFGRALPIYAIGFVIASVVALVASIPFALWFLIGHVTGVLLVGASVVWAEWKNGTLFS